MENDRMQNDLGLPDLVLGAVLTGLLIGLIIWLA